MDVFPPGAAWPAAVAVGLLMFLAGLTWADVAREGKPMSAIPTGIPPAPPSLESSIAALVELDRAHGDAAAKAQVAAQAQADAETAKQSAAQKLDALHAKLTAAYPMLRPDPKP